MTPVVVTVAGAEVRRIPLNGLACWVCSFPARHIAYPARVVVHGADARQCVLPPLDPTTTRRP